MTDQLDWPAQRRDHLTVSGLDYRSDQRQAREHDHARNYQCQQADRDRGIMDRPGFPEARAASAERRAPSHTDNRRCD